MPITLDTIVDILSSHVDYFDIEWDNHHQQLEISIDPNGGEKKYKATMNVLDDDGDIVSSDDMGYHSRDDVLAIVAEHLPKAMYLQAEFRDGREIMKITC